MYAAAYFESDPVKIVETALQAAILIMALSPPAG